MRTKLKDIDLILEVHDARVSLQEENPSFLKCLFKFFCTPVTFRQVLFAWYSDLLSDQKV